MLGDMPLVEASHIDRLIAAFNPTGRTICVPARNGRRGNPVLWGRSFFAELQGLEGDTGARSLIDTHSDQVAEVPVPSDAIFADFDTPEAFARLETA
jgi:molybdenum cofactor cytidylyltransferase